MSYKSLKELDLSTHPTLSSPTLLLINCVLDILTFFLTWTYQVQGLLHLLFLLYLKSSAPKSLYD